MFIALAQKPKFKPIRNKFREFRTDFEVATYAIDEEEEEKALEHLRTILGPKVPELQKALCEERLHKEGHYFTVWLHRVPDGQRIVSIPGVGLPDPSKYIKDL